MWHVHRYTEVERVYAPGIRVKDVEFANPDHLRKLLIGTTTILSRCCVCGKLDTVQVLGDARTPAPNRDSH